MKDSFLLIHKNLSFLIESLSNMTFSLMQLKWCFPSAVSYEKNLQSNGVSDEVISYRVTASPLGCVRWNRPLSTETDATLSFFACLKSHEYQSDSFYPFAACWVSVKNRRDSLIKCWTVPSVTSLWNWVTKTFCSTAFLAIYRSRYDNTPLKKFLYCHL